MELAAALWAKMHVIAAALILSTILLVFVRVAFVLAIRRHGSEDLYETPILLTLSDALAFRVWRKHAIPGPWRAFGLLYGVLWLANCVSMIAVSAIFIVAAASQ
jgi:hypothetical protein